MSDGPLNIDVQADPATCRASAAALRELSTGVGGLADAFAAVSGQSGFWQGEAGDAFREIADNGRGNADQVERNAQQLSQALAVFADEIDTVKSRLRQAAQVGAAAGLTVTGQVIQSPDPEPGPGPQAPDHERKMAAFNEASATVAEARGLERAAHDKLKAAAGQGKESTSALKTIGRTALTTSLSLVGGLSAASLKLVRSADKSLHLATLATALRATPGRTAAEQATLANAQRELYEQAAKDNFQSGQLDKVMDKLPDWAKNTLGYNLSDVVNDMKRAGTGIPRSLMDEIGVLKRLPVVGTAVTAGFAGYDIAHGADPAKTTEKAVGGLAAGAGVSAAVDGLVAAAGASSLVPGPGWIAAGVALGGAAAAWGVGKAVDAWGDDINDAVSSIF